MPAAKDDETRALAQALREGLATRADAEHQAWLAELTATVDVGRIVRALRLSSRPPKAGAPLPPELATRLAEGAGAALTDDAPAERWVAVLDALGLLAGARQGDPGIAPEGAPRRRAIDDRPPGDPDPEDRPHLRDRAGPQRPPTQGGAPQAQEAPAQARAEPQGQATQQAKAGQARGPSSPARPRQPKRRARPRRPEVPEEPTPPTESEAGEAAGGAGVSPADQAEGGSADPEPAQREPEASTESKPEEVAEGDRRGPEEGSADPEPAQREPEASTDSEAKPSELTRLRGGGGRRPPSSKDRPRYSPVTGSSSHRAPHDAHAHESRRSEARYRRSTS